ncbi:type VI secretion system baseplate subunit TssG [Acidisphaera sp. L21]|uniref:type VI secretion system baseplate subunit TssG n=1 Tax=Acidisphaera sp. L21 TaxID=1641851 RepID=UPI0020B1396B|nr:type VI secretion system baseplate subunit TssG [Acidisphaera sp. L21]
MTERGAADRLQTEPRRFSFDAAVRVLTFLRRRANPAEAVRFRSSTGLAFPSAEVLTVEPGEAEAPPGMAVTLFGLTGPSGVLPRHYTDAVVAGLRNRSRSLHDFLAVLSQAMTAFFAAAGTKYRPHRAADVAKLAGEGDDPVASALLALTGYGTPHLTDRLPAGVSPLQHYAGLFAARPRSADRLAALASDWLARPVEVQQFMGAWLPLPPDQRTSLARGLQLGNFSRLSEDATIGIRAWDQQARIVLRVGPLDADSFQALLPDRDALRRLVGLVRAFVGYEVGFAINPVLSRDALQPMSLGAADARLGWNSWIPAPGAAPPRVHPAEAVFEAELVEGLAH